MRRRRRWEFLLIAGLLCAVSTAASASQCGLQLGDRVEAAVDHPAGHPTLWEGMTGTVICFTYTWPLPVLVSWDAWTAGHNNDWFCETPILPYVFNSCWWVNCNEIRPAGGLPELFDGGEAERYFAARAARSSPTRAPGVLARAGAGNLPEPGDELPPDLASR